ncbi:sulfur carrier protein ThiS [Microlunatus antarcticus]|uniref:Sulfur carrier protein n=1 Tax=Microlunatus antarcticus TaxID=53388 RepID=A0A7W5JXY1_9ACTN|nr:sulfur carrier protein [Microlunatus antarcticus]
MIVFVNGEPREVTGPATLDQVLGLGGKAPRGFAVALDGVVVPRTRHQTTTLDEGARVEIVTAVQGG